MSHKPNDVSGLFPSKRIAAPSPNQTAKGTANLQRQAEAIRTQSLPKPQKRGSR